MSRGLVFNTRVRRSKSLTTDKKQRKKEKKKRKKRKRKKRPLEVKEQRNGRRNSHLQIWLKNDILHEFLLFCSIIMEQ